MSNDSLNGTVGQAARFASDYLFRNSALPSNTTIYSLEYTINNTLGKLMLVGTIDKNLSMAAGNTLTVALQYKDGTTWKTESTLLSASGATTFPAGQIFAIIPLPSETKRVFRLAATSNFNASDVKLTAAVEIMPSI